MEQEQTQEYFEKFLIEKDIELTNLPFVYSILENGSKTERVLKRIGEIIIEYSDLQNARLKEQNEKLRGVVKRLAEQLKTTHLSLYTYGKHPIIDEANSVLIKEVQALQSNNPER